VLAQRRAPKRRFVTAIAEHVLLQGCYLILIPKLRVGHRADYFFDHPWDRAYDNKFSAQCKEIPVNPAPFIPSLYLEEISFKTASSQLVLILAKLPCCANKNADAVVNPSYGLSWAIEQLSSQVKRC